MVWTSPRRAWVVREIHSDLRSVARGARRVATQGVVLLERARHTMSEKYYSTLTNDLARQYRLALAKRLTNYNPGYRSEFNQLKILNQEESNSNLNHLLSLKRPEIFRREQDAALSLVGINRKKRSRSKNKIRPTTTTFSQSTKPRNVPRSLKHMSVTTPRWFKNGGGDMTIHHRGRCSFDPKVMSTNTPGPQAYSNNHGLVGHGKVKGGGSTFGRSKSQRTSFGPREETAAVRERRNRRALMNEPDAEPINRSRLPPSPPRSPEILHKMPPKRAPFGTSGPRTHPLAQRNEMIGAAPAHGGMRRQGPGPKYNVRADATYRLPGVPFTFGNKSMKFSTSSRLPKAKTGIGPGPAYMPSYKAVEKSPTNPTMCPRRSYGSLYERSDRSDGPGPSYMPVYDNKGHIPTQPSFSFGDHDSRVRETLSRQSTRSPSRMPEPTLAFSKSWRAQSASHEGSRSQPSLGTMYHPSKELLAEANISEMRKEIWKKIRGGGGADTLYKVMDAAQ